MGFSKWGKLFWYTISVDSYLFFIPMSFILWIILGAIAGWLASIVMGRNAQQGLIMNIIVGVIGAFAGGYVVEFFGGDGVTGFNIYSLFVAVIGAVILLWIVGRIFKR